MIINIDVKTPNICGVLNEKSVFRKNILTHCRTSVLHGVGIVSIALEGSGGSSARVCSGKSKLAFSTRAKGIAAGSRNKSKQGMPHAALSSFSLACG